MKRWRRPDRRSGLTLLLALSVLVLAACGGASAGGTRGSIHFVVLHPFTGKYAGVGAAAYAGSAVAAREINAGGGILGQDLVIDQADTVGDPADAVPALNKALAANHDVGVIGPGGLEVGATKPILDRNHIVFMLQAGNTSFDKNSDKYLWRANPSDSQLSVAMALYAVKKGYKRAAMMFSTIESAQTLKAPIQSVFEKNGGHIVADKNLSPGQSSYSSEVLDVKNSRPDVIFTQMEPSTAGPVMAGFKSLGALTIPFVGSDITAGSDFVQAITPAVAHDVFTSLEGADVTGSAQEQFRTYYEKVYPGKQPLADANYAYDATLVLALAMTKAGSSNGDKVAAQMTAVANPPGKQIFDYKTGVDAIKAGTKINYEGASGPMDFNDQHNVFGPFNAVQSDTAGKLQVVTTLSARDLEGATS